MSELGVILLGGGALALLAMVVYTLQEASGGAHSSGTQADLEHLHETSNLDPSALYDVVIWRQSGNLHRHGSTGVTKDQAIKEIVSTMRRAKVEFVTLDTNTESELTVWRAVYNARGKQEGKRVGGATIERSDTDEA